MENDSHQLGKDSRQVLIHRTLLGFGFLLGFLWPLYRLIFSSGWILDDELSHFLFSKSVVHWPEILLDEWARPGRNLIHSIIAPFGLTATRLYTLILSTLAVFLCYRVTIKLNIFHAWSIPFLLCFQPWYPELSYPVLTQAPFMLVWMLGIYLALTQRYHLAAFCFGYLSLIRHEGILITALWGIWVISQPGGLLHDLLQKKRFSEMKNSLTRSMSLGLMTILPILILNLCGYYIQGSIPFAVYFDSNPTDIYGSGSLFHYASMIPDSVGSMILVLSMLGLYFILKLRPKNWSIILVTYPAYFILHSVIYWKGSFASGGYYHFLMPMAPLFALLAAVGLSKILTSRFFKSPWLAAVIISVICYQGLHMDRYQHSNQDWSSIMAGKSSYKESLFAPVDTASTLSDQIREATDFARADSELEDHFIHSAHVYFYYLTDQPDTAAFRKERLAALSTFPKGSYYIWDRQYADLEARTSRAEFEKNPNWQALKSWHKSNSEVSVIVYKKINDTRYEENISPKGKNLSY